MPSKIALVTGASRGLGRSMALHLTVDPSPDGAEIVNAMSDRMRAEILGKMGLSDLMHPSAAGPRTSAGQPEDQ